MTSYVFGLFMDSSGHRANIMGKAWDVVAVGAYRTTGDHYVWTVLFADRCGGASPGAAQAHAQADAQADPEAHPEAHPEGDAHPQGHAEAHAEAHQGAQPVTDPFAHALARPDAQAAPLATTTPTPMPAPASAASAPPESRPCPCLGRREPRGRRPARAGQARGPRPRGLHPLVDLGPVLRRVSVRRGRRGSHRAPGPSGC